MVPIDLSKSDEENKAIIEAQRKKQDDARKARERYASAERSADYARRYEEALTRGQILITPEMSNDEILEGINNDQTEFAHYFNQMTGGKGWDVFHLLFSSGSGMERRQMWMTLSLINQNKILIRQNELIRRLLEKIAS